MSEAGEISVSYLLIVGTAGMVVMAISIISFIIFYQRRQMRQQSLMLRMREDHQKNLLNATFQTQEGERRRIAQDLHDEIGALLSTAKLGLDQLGRQVTEEHSKEMTLRTKGLLDEIISNVRKISKDLLPATLEDFGLVDAISELVKKIHYTGGIQIDFEHNDAERRFDPDRELTLFRIVQELINNSIKHSGGDSIELSLYFEPRQLTLVLQDNGKGFNYEKTISNPHKRTGLGLKNIENRLGLHDASLRYVSTPGQGVRVEINMDI